MNLREHIAGGAAKRGAAMAFVRSRVLGLLRDAAAYPVTAAIAPAGFGKSIAIRHFLDDTDVSWIRYGVTLEGETLMGFLNGFCDALLPVAPELRSTMTTALRTGERSREWVVSMLREQLGDYDGFIHIDDLHFCDGDPEIAAVVSLLVERSPENVRWIIAGRRRAGYPLATWTAYDRMGTIVDEAQLRLTRDEAFACARLFSESLDDAAIEAAYALSDAWPAAFMLALRTSPDSAGIPGAGSRTMIYGYLAEQVFQKLSDEQRDFLREICFYKAIDLEVLADEWDDLERIIDDLQRDVPFVRIENGVLYCDGLFADFVQHQIARGGKSARRDALLRSARRCERGGRHTEALALYVRAGEGANLALLLAEHGVRLVESGRAELVETALGLLEPGVRDSAPFAVIAASVCAARGEFSRSEALYERAVESAGTGPEATRARYRYALELIRRNRKADRERLGEVIDALRAGIGFEDDSSDERALLLGTIATGYAIIRRDIEAGDFVRRALAVAERSPADATRALLYHQASFVAYTAGDWSRASTFSARALALAERLGLFALAARCRSIRYSICTGQSYDTQAALIELHAMIEAATKAGDAFLTVNALAGAYALHAEAGETECLDELRERITQNPASGELSTSAIASADAMRLAWSADYSGALARVKGTAQAQISGPRRALRSAEIALYAGAAGERELASTAIADAVSAEAWHSTERPEDRRRFAVAHAYAALALLMIHQPGRANALIASAESESREFGPLERLLTKAARSAYLHVEVHEDLTPSLLALKRAGLGGYAALLEQLPLPGGAAAASPLGVLTKTELAVLRELSRGATNTSIAASLGRSQNTINAHVAAILRKLHCRTRQDAGQLAREHGIGA